MLIDKTSFLALDIGTGRVRGFGVCVKNGIAKNYLHTDSNIVKTIDAIEEELNTHFNRVFVTGNFGLVRSIFGKNSLFFPKMHKVMNTDVYNAIFNSPDIQNVNGQTLHLIPLRFMTNTGDETRTTDNLFCQGLTIQFNCITYPNEVLDDIKKELANACIPSAGFFDPIYMLGQTYWKGGATVFIDFGKTITKVGVYKDRGLISRFDIDSGQGDITQKISTDFGIAYEDAENIKLFALSGTPTPSDNYISASEKFPNIMRQDIWDRWFNINNAIIDEIFGKIKTDNFNLFITGSGDNPDNIKRLILENKGFEKITVLNEYAIVGSFGNTFKNKIPKIKKKVYEKSSTPGRIIPSVMLWNVQDNYTYKMFESLGIQKLHCDIMDGFYTEQVHGSLTEIKAIRSHTKLLLHTHLMVEDPMIWYKKAAASGADIIIVSTGSRNVTETLMEIKKIKRLAGLALHPDFNLKELNLEILSILDEVMVMGVNPGASGQTFIPQTLDRIKILNNTRKKYNLKYKITVDGGINDENSQDCWKAGADFLVSGSFLRGAPDLADAILKLSPQKII